MALPSSGFLHSGLAPWARCHPPSMAGGSSRRIHAARPTPQDLRSACTQVAMGVVWNSCVGRSTATATASAACLFEESPWRDEDPL
uniref:Uncharacterized protein n=1 Tax=Pseudomonas graminis TaxID=158627 RepID=A0A7C1WVM9_9PSED